MVVVVVCIGVILGLLDHVMWVMQQGQAGAVSAFWGAWFMIWAVYAVMLLYVIFKKPKH